MDRVILHSDMNGFYASCEMLYHPEFQGYPLAVGGDPENRHGIILAKNQKAKLAGVKTGEALWQARGKCPGLIIVKPNYALYQRLSKKAREIYYTYTDQVESFGLDECWLDCTHSLGLFGSGEDIARQINQRIKRELGLTVSIGVSWNKIFAKFGSDYKKPDAITLITRDNYQNILWPAPVGDLLYVGRATERKLRQSGIDTVGRLAGTPLEFLRNRFGKIGDVLWQFANGWDLSEVKEMDGRRFGNDRLIKSIGNSITTPRDLTTLRELKLVVHLLGESVAARLRESGCWCQVVAVHLRTKDLNSFTRQIKLSRPTDLTSDIVFKAIEVIEGCYHYEQPVRSMGIQVTQLTPAGIPVQLSLMEDEERRIRMHALDMTVDGLHRRFGNHSVRKAITLGDEMSLLDPKRDNVIHPVGYF
jgi:DNA polymerase-4